MFPVIQIAYWLALATWFGGLLFVAIAAPVVFRTVRDADPTLPKVLSVNLDGQHATLLSGTIVGNILESLRRVQLICAGILLLAILGQWFFIDRNDKEQLVGAIVRTALYLGAVAMLLYDWRVVWPRIQQYRNEYIDHADEPDVANPAKENFDRYHQESVTIVGIMLLLLLGMILFSGNIRPAVLHIVSP
jgi:hypothetical protein